MAGNHNLTAISGLANPKTQASGTRALIELLKGLFTDLYGPPGGGGYGALRYHTGLSDMPSKSNSDHDQRYITEISATEPASPINGKLWFDTTEPGIVSTSVGVPAGGTTSQVLAKASDDDHDTEWVDQSGGGGANITVDTYANRPASPSDGDIFLPTNSLYAQVYDTSAWKSWGPVWKCSPIVLSDFSWVNQGGATAVESGGGVYFYAPVGTSNVRALVKNIVGNYSVTVGFIPHLHGANYQTIGLALRESSTGKIIAGYISQSHALGVSKWTDENTYSGAYSIATGVSNAYSLTNRSQVIWLRFVDNGTNRLFYTSYNGLNWELVHSVGRTDFCTCDQVGFYIDNNNKTYKAFATFIHWSQI